MVTLFVRHDIADYAAWRKEYDAFDATRKRLGVSGSAVYRSAESDTNITVTHDFETLEAAKAFTSSPELRAAMTRAGVVRPSSIWFASRT